MEVIKEILMVLTIFVLFCLAMIKTVYDFSEYFPLPEDEEKD